MYTRKRPGSAMWLVMRAPFLPIGSLAIWTRISCPSLSRSVISGIFCCWLLRDRRPPPPPPRRSIFGGGFRHSCASGFGSQGCFRFGLSFIELGFVFRFFVNFIG